MTIRLQDLTTYEKHLTADDIFEVSEALDARVSHGHISKHISYQDILETCFAAISSQVSDVQYSFTSFPVGLVAHLSQPFANLSVMLSSAVLPLNGIRVISADAASIADESLSSPQVCRPDLAELFTALDLMVDITEQGAAVKEGCRLELFSTESEYSKLVADHSLDGCFLYSPTAKSVRLPDIRDCYIKSTSLQVSCTTKQEAQLPDIYGTFANGMTDGEIADSRPLSALYTGSLFIAAENAIDYYEEMNNVSNAIYKKSLSKKKRDADLLVFDPSKCEWSSAYQRSDDKVFFDSVKLCPCIVVKPQNAIVKGL